MAGTRAESTALGSAEPLVKVPAPLTTRVSVSVLLTPPSFLLIVLLVFSFSLTNVNPRESGETILLLIEVVSELIVALAEAVRLLVVEFKATVELVPLDDGLSESCLSLSSTDCSCFFWAR